MTIVARGVVWIGLYFAVAVAPLVLALLGDRPPGRDLVTEVSLALGFVGLSLMGLQFVLVGRFQPVAGVFGDDAVTLFHRYMGYVAFAMILAHPALLFFTDTPMGRLLNPVTAPWRARFAVAAVVCLIVLVITSVWRKRLRIRYEVWQVLHGVLSIVIVVLALAHIQLVGYYVNAPWKQVVWTLSTAAFIAVLGWVRIVRPILRLGRPWEVVAVRPERGNAYTIRLRPVGHEGIRFEPGQFGWIIIGRGPFATTQHPFSFSSSAEVDDGSVEMTIKAVGDFSSTVGDIPVGTRAWVDGPHGVFSPDRNEGPGFVLIGGGVGITPLMSIMRTMADRDDRRPVLLVTANPRLEDATFLEEIESLTERLDLRVVHVVERPDSDWTGETGFVDADLLRRHLPQRAERQQYFVCGPPPMLDALETVLGDDLRIPIDHIHTERFEFV
jgi:predicted ferric reductase